MAKKGTKKKAKKGQKPAKKKTSKRGQTQAESFPPADLRLFEPNESALESASETAAPLEIAQEIVYEAFESDSSPERIELAEKALEVCPDCADAHVLLAEQARNLDDAVRRYRQGVAAGRKALGETIFRQAAGHFWLMPETRPYMRAVFGLAQTLRAAGQREEAAELLGELLQLNPNDNQGARCLLAGCLLELGRDDELQRLLADFPDDTLASWSYAKTLLAFRRGGDSPEARELLDQALQRNRHVPRYLLGDVFLPSDLPGFFGPGEEDEAILYAADFLAAWKTTPGAISWLRKASKTGLPEPDEDQPLTFVTAKQDLVALPQEDELWQADVRRLPGAVEVGGEKLRLWSAMVANCSVREVPAMDVSEERPTDEILCELLIHAMVEPTTGAAHRPQTIEVGTKKRCQAWQADLAELGIDCVYCKPLGHLDELFEKMGPLLAAGSAASAKTDLVGAAAAGLAELRQEVAEVWQADILRLPTWIDVEGEPTRPWIVLVTDASNDLILAHDLSTEQPHPDVLWEKLSTAMQLSMAGDSHRPAEVRVRSEDHRNVVGPRLEEIGIRCVVSDELEQLDGAFESLAEHLAGPPSVAALVEVPGVEPQQVGSYFDAAAHFFQSSPWNYVPGDTVIKIECAKFETGCWYAVVMGQSGITLGLALYDDPETLGLLLSGSFSEEEAGRRTSGLSVTFDEEFGMAIADLEAAEQFGWPVATPEAYPCAMRVNPGRSVRPPLAWELELLEGSLRAVPEFLAEQDEPAGPRQIEIPVASGRLEMVLSWADDVAPDE